MQRRMQQRLLGIADSDPTRFLAYLIAALQTVAPKIGEGVLRLLQSPPPREPSGREAIPTALLSKMQALAHWVHGDDAQDDIALALASIDVKLCWC